MKKPMLIRQSPMTKRWYAITNYEWLDKEHSALVVKGKKQDVTDEIERILRGDETMQERGREIAPPIVPTTCRCSTYESNFRQDTDGNKWCTLCGDYKGSVND